jgi:single-strand DNA-binding protein
MKNITIAGGLTKDAELRSTQNGDKVAGFSVAVSEGFGDSKRTLYFDCSIWGKRAETLAPMLTKGGKVCVTGDLSTREYNGKTSLTVRVAEVTLLSAKRDDAARYDQSPDRSQRAPAGNTGGDMDDEVPFGMEWR